MSSNRRGGGSGAGSPVYQIDFTAIAAGKRIASTKRRVRWRFGFTNQDALSNGETGTACRGEEHDITLVWSITSGKRLILADGQEVHYSISRASICDFSWTMRGNHVLKLVAHASPPMNAQPGFRQYDFFVDGRSFFDMPKVYRLGLAGKDARAYASPAPVPTAVRHTVESERSAGGHISVAKVEAPSNPDEEEAYFKQAIQASIEEKEKADKKRDEELRKSQLAAQQKAAGSDLLLDFTAGTPAPAPVPVAAPLPALPAPTPAADPFSPAPQPTFNEITSEFPAPAPAPVRPVAPVGYPAPVAAAPQAAPAAPFAAAPVAPAAPAALTASITAPAAPAALNASFAAPPAPAAAPDPFAPSAAPVPPTDPTMSGSFVAAPAAPTPAAAAPAPPAAAAAPTLSMFDTPKEEPKGPPMGSSADQALSKFADMDNFVAPKKPVKKENPFDAPAPSLAGLKAMGGAAQGGQKKDVMNAPPGAMVVSGQQQGNWGGAYAQPGAPAAQPYGQSAAGGQYGGYGGQQQMQQPQYQQTQQYQGQYQQPQQQQYYQQQPPPQQGFGTMQYPQQR